MIDYIFLATYNDNVGLFSAPTIIEAREMAWSGLEQMVEPGPESFFIRPATHSDIKLIKQMGDFSPDGEIMPVNQKPDFISLEDANKIVFPDHFQRSQWNVLKLKIMGYTGRQIAEELKLKLGTVNDRYGDVKQILHLTEEYSTREIMQWAIENGLVEIKF